MTLAQQSKNYQITHAWYEQLVAAYTIVSNSEPSKHLKIDPATPKTIVEIGVYEGASSCWWLDNFMEHPDSRLFSIDPFTGNQEHQDSPEMHPTLDNIEVIAKANIAKSKYPGKATVIKGCSWDVFPQLKALLPSRNGQNPEIDILYIDGEHTTEAVMRDMMLYIPLVKQNGLVVMDDYGSEAVKIAGDYANSANKFFKEAFFTGWQLWATKN